MTSAPLMIISVDRELSISEQQRIAVRWRGPYDWSRRGGPMNLIAAENYAAIAAAVAQHKPRLEEMQAYECMNGDCDHDTECPMEDVVVCSYCFWLNTEINDELIVNAVLAENCPVCVAAYPEGYPSVTDEP